MNFKDFYSSSGIPKATSLGAKRKANWPKRYINHFLSDFPNLRRVLEIGPGDGEFAKECIERNFNYLGIESSETYFKKLNSKDIEVIHARVPPIPLDNNSFCLIHAEHVIEHFNSVREFTFFLSECHRTLIDEGVLSISYPNYLTQGRLFYDWSYSHFVPFTKYNLERACLDYGFKVVRSACYLPLFLCKNSFVNLLRHPFIWFSKIINFPVFREISDEIKALKNLRLRITKNCLDSVTVIAQKESLDLIKSV